MRQTVHLGNERLDADGFFRPYLWEVSADVVDKGEAWNFQSVQVLDLRECDFATSWTWNDLTPREQAIAEQLLIEAAERVEKERAA